MRHRRFVTRLLNRPQMIEPGAAAAVAEFLTPGVEKIGAWASDGDPAERDAREYQVTRQRTAIVPVVGELVHRGGGMEAMSGVTSYQALADTISAALADPDVSAILMDVDSPGGEAAGVLEFSEWLAAQRGTKPIWASVNQMACSAAYAIASAADRVLIAPDAAAGSIGVVAAHKDMSEALKKQGTKITFVYAGAHKVEGNSAEPLSDDAHNSIQQDVNQLYNRFCAVVAANRGLTVEAVKATEAKVFRGAEAVKRGLADEVSTMESALMAVTKKAAKGARMDTTVPNPFLSAQPTQIRAASEASPDPQPGPAPEKPAEGGSAEPEAPAREPDRALPTEEDLGDMSAEEAEKQPRKNTPASPAPAQSVANACQAAGHPELIAGLLASGASMADVRSRIEAAQEITKAAAKVGLTGMASVLIESGMSLDQARRAMFAAKAASGDAIRTDSGHTGTAPAKAGPISASTASAVYDRFNGASRKQA